MNLFDLTKKNAVVIGGTSTLGSAIAVGLAGHGASVVVVGRDNEKAKAVKARIEQTGGDAKSFILSSATDKEELIRLEREIVDWRGGTDILVNSAGVNSTTPFFEITETEWDHIMDVNLKAVLLACQVFGAAMIQRGRGGSVINISSASSDPPLSKVVTYSASKAAINNLTQYLAREFASERIRVNAIVPGFFPAEQNRKILTPERTEDILRHTPMMRFGEASELQGAAVWLASESASGFVTGALIRVDGGFGAMTI
ncbi:SDR family oxidoreductase [Alicyclobacillus sp. SO9]|uniref:SDR family oxidoreductase n=1 Tax=Alicyclobacillus sp. SO9 TaxID=2665646 RepID=UPI0018E71F25|nr:SDR family oxidoreductase [Alicyclobacillus sp. SO9]QQE77921.1 SDR family oxidoreductase [Alicyclobacillus sp. SO9]